VASDVDFEEFSARLEGTTGADIESLCKKATLLAISEFQNGTRSAPFVVLRNDFMAVLDSDRGSPRQLEQANEKNSSTDTSCDARTK
jgi:SpoVK/Ycf46/Vps4 family AAA+-type ATPase